MKFYFLLFFLIVTAISAWQVFPTQAGDNIAPTIESVYLSSSANAKTDAYPGGTINDLVPGGALAIHINGVVEDLDGRDNIDKVNTIFYRSSVTGGLACTPDKNSCYRVNACVLTDNANPNQKEYDCEILIQYFADSTDNGGNFPADSWFVFVKVEDVATESDIDTTVTKELQTILSLNIPSILDFGPFSLGDSTDTGTNIHYTITQYGNDRADVEVSGSAMVCQNGQIPVGNQEWSLTDVAYGQGTDLTDSAVNTYIDIGYRTDDATELSKIIYWNLGVPISGVVGTCNGMLTIDAVAH
ncbi:MAG: hypothetical protein ABIH67_03495 [Candidatus Uhrbacteria bacterium]